jgi:hypothetical protein
MNLKILYDNCNRPFLARLNLITLFGWSLKLHVFIRSDADKELHDHPWSFWTLVLAGGYHEVTESGIITRKPGSLAYRPANWKHRVALRVLGFNQGEFPCATLVLTSPVKRELGFWREGKFIPWREFVSRSRCDE